MSDQTQKLEPATRVSKILVVDDQPELREALCEHLKRNGFSAQAACDAGIARQMLGETDFDLVVLDVMMPGESGLSLCRDLSETTQVPVILLTALTDASDKIIGLEIGADDYIAKPFNPRELVARIRSVLRRSNKGNRASKAPSKITFGPWRLNLGTGELRGKDNIIISLSTGELRVLRAFVENINIVLSRDDLFNLTKGRDGFAFERSMDNMISRLRKKIEPDPSSPIYIRTVWGNGYRFVANQDP